jgi:PAS domain-containing protein
MLSRNLRSARLAAFPRTLAVRRPLGFSDRIYKNVPFGDLVNSYVILKLCKTPFFINNIDTLARFGHKIMGDTLFFAVLKETMGRHFTAGETTQEAHDAVEKFGRQGFKSALGYMAEFDNDLPDETGYDKCLQSNLDTLHINRERQEPDFFFAIKFSGLIQMSVLKKMNENQRKIEKIFTESFPLSNKIELKFEKIAILQERLRKLVPGATQAELDQFFEAIPRLSDQSRPDALNLFEWKLGCAAYNWTNPHMNENPLWQQLTGYTQEDLTRIKNLERRVRKILEEMRHTKSYLLMDAEQSFVQLAINNITEQMGYLENYKRGHPVVFNTIQNYLVTAPNTIANELAKKQFFGPDYPVLMKLVRGAYHIEEQRVEKATGQSIVWKTKQETNDTYNNNCQAIVAHLCPKSRLFVASHNEETVEIVEQAIDTHPNKEQLEKQVYFGTLMGLNDRLAYKCLEDGKTTVKFMPFGERHLTLAYMIRRSYESRDLIMRNGEQVSLFSEEIKNRLLLKDQLRI